MRILSVLAFVVLFVACKTNTPKQNEINTTEPVPGLWSVEKLISGTTTSHGW